eukprot:jgi/Tetstr1/459490/TSEL_004857.t1
MTAFNQQELQFQAEIVEAERKQEALRRKLEQMRRKRGVLEAFSVDVATICHGFVNNDNRPTKRTRRDGRGRTDTVDDVMGVGEDPVGEDGMDIDAPAWPPAGVEPAMRA